MNHQILIGPAEEVYRVRGPLLCPYYNRWGRNVYQRSEPFRDNPFTVYASSTSGSPVVQDQEGRFYGFMEANPTDGATIEFDGHHTLKIHVPEGQRLYSGGPASDGEHWRKYNTQMMQALDIDPVASRPAHWTAVEYCTWVEQKRRATTLEHATPLDALDEAMVLDYLQRVIELGYPKGKFTIDHGWQKGHETYGDWDIDALKFPNFERLIGQIADAGFTPGLWLAPVWLHPKSYIASAHPEALGGQIVPSNPDSPHDSKPWRYWKPGSVFRDQMARVFNRFYRMGVMKFKLDMTYAAKDTMLSLHEILYDAVKKIDQEIEIEIHQPDVFFSQYADAIRTNDVLCNEAYEWQELTAMHSLICERSAPGKVINLDHIGGNDPRVSGPQFLEHLESYRGAVGHPVVSLLPDHLGQKVADDLGRYLEQYDRTRHAVSQFWYRADVPAMQ